MKLKDILLTELTNTEMKTAAGIINRTFIREYGIVVQFKPHAQERALTREANITLVELLSTFDKFQKKYTTELTASRDRKEKFVGIIKDRKQQINIPFIRFCSEKPRPSGRGVKGADREAGVDSSTVVVFLHNYLYYARYGHQARIQIQVLPYA